MSITGNSWTPDSWRQKPAGQQPDYPDPQALAAAAAELARLPPLVTSWEVETLRAQLAEAARGERFLLQGGDCCESFDDCGSDAIARKLKILLQMSLVLVYGSRHRVIRVGRFAGQYAKPRSAATETRNGQTLPCYRGSLVNRPGFSAAERTPNPDLLLRGYERAALTLNFIRALCDGGFADLHHPEYWDLGFVNHARQAKEYQKIVDSIGESVRFMETLAGEAIEQFRRVEFFTSHEGLLLEYERAQTRQVPRRPGWYNLSTHFPWIGDRTRSLDGAHVEFFRGIANPVGVKVGPSMAADEIVSLCRALDPQNQPGRLTLIHRFGAEHIATCLPPLVQAMTRAGHDVLWVCDPMHGNTTSTPEGIKTRRFEAILSEVEQAFAIHAQERSILGGVHIELTGDNVTECTGGARGLNEADLATAYKSEVDPRLNYEQAMELALVIAGHMGRMGQSVASVLE